MSENFLVGSPSWSRACGWHLVGGSWRYSRKYSVPRKAGCRHHGQPGLECSVLRKKNLLWDEITQCHIPLQPYGFWVHLNEDTNVFQQGEDPLRFCQPRLCPCQLWLPCILTTRDSRLQGKVQLCTHSWLCPHQEGLPGDLLRSGNFTLLLAAWQSRLSSFLCSLARWYPQFKISSDVFTVSTAWLTCRGNSISQGRKKEKYSVLHAVIPELRKLRQENCFMFETSLDYHMVNIMFVKVT